MSTKPDYKKIKTPAEFAFQFNKFLSDIANEKEEFKIGWVAHQFLMFFTRFFKNAATKDAILIQKNEIIAEARQALTKLAQRRHTRAEIQEELEEGYWWDKFCKDELKTLGKGGKIPKDEAERHAMELTSAIFETTPPAPKPIFPTTKNY